MFITWGGGGGCTGEGGKMNLLLGVTRYNSEIYLYVGIQTSKLLPT